MTFTDPYSDSYPPSLFTPPGRRTKRAAAKQGEAMTDVPNDPTPVEPEPPDEPDPDTETPPDE